MPGYVCVRFIDASGDYAAGLHRFSRLSVHVRPLNTNDLAPEKAMLILSRNMSDTGAASVCCSILACM